MPAKLTTQDFIDRARAVHGDKYGYAFSVYQSAHEKVMVYCHEHGMFEQSPWNHLKGKGCYNCFGSKKHTDASFIKKAREVHGDRYNYSLVKYTGNKNKVTVFCYEHGDFEQTPNDHLNGRGCSKCADTKLTNEYFVKKAREVHGDKYDYSLTNYTGNKNKVTVFCYEHGNFQQYPSNHLKGHGCPGCARSGFDRTKNGFLYVLRSDCGSYMKIGITNNTDRRHTELTRDTPFSFKRIELIEGPGNQIANLEKELLAKYQPVGFTERFDGSTEWRLWDDSVRGYLV